MRKCSLHFDGNSSRSSKTRGCSQESHYKKDSTCGSPWDAQGQTSHQKAGRGAWHQQIELAHKTDTKAQVANMSTSVDVFFIFVAGPPRDCILMGIGPDSAAMGFELADH